jgi:metal-responsive CopG/Arc/MetJ family transcriptional regulator
MSNTSWQVKARYNAKAYKSFSTQIKPELFEQIDNYCKEHGLSRSQFLEQAINALTNNNGAEE